MEPKLRFKEFSGDWEEKKGKKIFINISNKNHNGDLEVLSATQDQGVIPRSCLDIDIKFDTKNLKSYKKIEKGDFFDYYSIIDNRLRLIRFDPVKMNINIEK